MKSAATIKDVALKANVSTTSVSRFLNGVPVSEEIAVKIQAAIQETEYQPNMLARNLKLQSSRQITLVVPDICNPFYSLMAKTVQRIANKRDYVISFFDTDEKSDREVDAICAAQQQRSCGLLFACVDIKARVMRQLRQCRFPVICLNAYSEDSPFDSVHVLNNGGTFIAMQHLLEKGHRRIVYAGGTPNSMIELSRRHGYEHAMCEHGLPLEEQNIFEMGFSQEDGFKAGRYFSTIRPLPTAVCCANDQIALGVIDALQSVGLNVPGDVSIVGMDDILYGRTSKPSLTTVTNDGAMYAELGIKLLFERIDGVYTGEKREEAVPNELIQRESVRSLAADAEEI